MKTPNKPPRPARSVTTTLALAFFLLSVAILVIFNSVQLSSMIQEQRSTLTSTQQAIAKDAVTSVRSFILEYVNTLETAVRMHDLTDLSQTDQRTLLESLIGYKPALKRLVLLDAHGGMINQAARLSTDAPLQATDEILQLALQATKQGDQYISPVYVDQTTNEPTVMIALPSVDVVDEVHGTLLAEINLKFMWELVRTLKVGIAGQVYVVDHQGLLLAFSDTTRVLRHEQVGNIQAVAAFIQQRDAAPATTVSTYAGISGTTVVGTYVPLGKPDWAVVIEVPWLEAYRSIIQRVVISVGLMIVIAILAGLLGMILADRLAVPLVSLMEMATRIAGGERDLQAVVQGPREITNLAHAFNTMTTELRTTLEALEQHVASLQAALAEVNALAAEQAHLLEENVQQRQVIRDMSVPILPVTHDTLVMPLIGAIDSERLTTIRDQALQVVQHADARRLLMDITGIPVVDSQVAQGILEIAQAARLLGTEVVLIGIRPEVAQTIVGLQLDLMRLATAADLQTALNQTMARC